MYLHTSLPLPQARITLFPRYSGFRGNVQDSKNNFVANGWNFVPDFMSGRLCWLLTWSVRGVRPGSELQEDVG